ncbi:MAG: hypothetical protein U0T69_04205 [Chitinophagales bacterium]
MEKIKCVTLIIAVVSIIAITKAEEPSVIRKGLLKTQITISPAVFFKNKQSLFYLHGNVEGFVTCKISVTGDAYMSLGNTGVAAPTFKFNHNIFFGASYHITKKNNDFYLGLQPGISITKVILLSDNTKPAKTGVNPVVAIVIGYNYYVHKYFHFFVQSRFVTGQHLYNTRKDLSEFRFSAGLGFNINAKRK